MYMILGDKPVNQAEKELWFWSRAASTTQASRPTHDIHPHRGHLNMKVTVMCLPEHENRVIGVGFRREKGSLSVGSKNKKKIGPLFGVNFPK